MRILYTLIGEIARYVLPLLARFNPKIEQFQNQRKTTSTDIAHWKQTQTSKPVLWLHCASLGEYDCAINLE